MGAKINIAVVSLIAGAAGGVGYGMMLVDETKLKLVEVLKDKEQAVQNADRMRILNDNAVKKYGKELGALVMAAGAPAAPAAAAREPLDTEKFRRAIRRLFLSASVFTASSFETEMVRCAAAQPKRILQPSRGETTKRPQNSMPAAEHQVLEWQQYRLDAQQHGVHDADGVDGMQHQAPEEADVF